MMDLPAAVAALVPREAPSPLQLLSRERTLRLSERGAALTHLVSALEHLVDSRTPEAQGLKSYTISVGGAIRLRPLRQAVTLVARRRPARVLAVARVAASAALLAPTAPRTRLVAGAVLTTAQLVSSPSTLHGADGSDHAAFLVTSAAAAARAGGGRPSVTDACLWFIGSQCAFNYGVSGWTKLLGPRWRSGEALAGILRTKSYGHAGGWRAATRLPRASRALARSIVAWESLFPLALVGPGRRLAPGFVASAEAFHVANGVLMGLNRFMYAFAGMHPAVLYLSGPRERVDEGGRLEARDDSAPVVALVVGAAGALGTALAARRLARRAARGRPGDRTLTTASGDVLSLRRTGPPETDGPLLVCVPGLRSTGEHFEWLARALGERFPVVTYSRAGSGASTCADPDRDAADTALDDLIDLVRHESPDRPVVLVGHSLGGYVAWRAASRLGDRVQALALLDPSHPEELSPADGATGDLDGVERSLRRTARLLRLGLGPLHETSRWARWLPPEVGRLVDAQDRTAGTWRTAWRELRDHRRACALEGLVPHDVPTLVATAAKTAADSARVLELHRAMAAAPGGEHRVVHSSDHESLLLAKGPATRTATVVADFVTRAAAASSVDRPTPTRPEEASADASRTA